MGVGVDRDTGGAETVMSRFDDVKGVMKMLFSGAKEDWNRMDKKFYRLAFGIITFALMALFWFYFLRNLSPFGF